MNRILMALIGVLLISNAYAGVVIKDNNIEIQRLRKEKRYIESEVFTEAYKQQLQISQLKDEYCRLKKKRFLTEQDIKSLEKIVEVEATGEGLEGKRLVACVVLNRWQHSTKTVNQIIVKPRQFSPVVLGKYYSSKPTEETNIAVMMATYRDYSHGSLYFMNPKIASRGSARWFRTALSPTVKHNRHYFFK